MNWSALVAVAVGVASPIKYHDLYMENYFFIKIVLSCMTPIEQLKSGNYLLWCSGMRNIWPGLANNSSVSFEIPFILISCIYYDPMLKFAFYMIADDAGKLLIFLVLKRVFRVLFYL